MSVPIIKAKMLELKKQLTGLLVQQMRNWGPEKSSQASCPRSNSWLEAEQSLSHIMFLYSRTRDNVFFFFLINFNTHSCLDQKVKATNIPCTPADTWTYIFLIRWIVFWVTLLFKIMKKKSWGSERFNCLPRVTHREGKELGLPLCGPPSRNSRNFDIAKYQSYSSPTCEPKTCSRNSRCTFLMAVTIIGSGSPLQYEIIILLPVTFFCRLFIFWNLKAVPEISHIHTTYLWPTRSPVNNGKKWSLRDNTPKWCTISWGYLFICHLGFRIWTLSR